MILENKNQIIYSNKKTSTIINNYQQLSKTSHTPLKTFHLCNI
jgi:hypothetical protein